MEQKRNHQANRSRTNAFVSYYSCSSMSRDDIKLHNLTKYSKFMSMVIILPS
ncbi:conserved hypothetical protein [Ricinus communis]|uniref:Uncharacterized protein n=1 Tax=Ricinus communis TaxID=3988 RepID=B9SJA8_RICCO|nr:conserved hypothetical protein [Ricinus communis]